VTLLESDVVCSPEWTDVLGEGTEASLSAFHREVADELLQDYSWAWIVERAKDEERRHGLRIVFMRPADAVRFAVRLQARIRAASASMTAPLHARVAIHMGEVLLRRWNGRRGVGHVEGRPVTATARVLSAARGGQILMTGGVFRNALAVLRGEGIPGLRPIAWVNHGPYRIHGTGEVMELCEAGEHGPAPFTPPPEDGDVSRLERAQLQTA